MQPIQLGVNQPESFYRGAGRIGAFRGLPADPGRPEDWLGSATPRRGRSTAGLTLLADGTSLRDAIDADPVAWVGSTDPDTGVLVKLLDAGQRLPLHFHPDRDFARSHLASPYGKTEAWIVLEAEPGAGVHLGWNRDVEAAELHRWVEAQDTAALLAATNRVGLAAGDAVLCPAGTPHAIDGGVLLLEVQEPTDLSLLLEWDGFTTGPPRATLGLGLDEALACVDRRACTPSRLQVLRTAAPGSLLPAEAGEFFQVDEVSGPVGAGFAVLVVTSGQGELAGAWGATPIVAGNALVVPYAAGPYAVSGSVTVVRCRAGNAAALDSRVVLGRS